MAHALFKLFCLNTNRFAFRTFFTNIAVKDLSIRGQGVHALLDARPARVVESDDRRTILQRQVEHLADLLTVMTEVKHPYMKGIDAREGIEF